MALYYSPTKGLIDTSKGGQSAPKSAPHRTKTTYYSPSTKKFFSSFDNKTVAPSAPVTYYSPSKGKYFQSFDEKHVATKPEWYDAVQNQGVIDDILGQMDAYQTRLGDIEKFSAQGSDDLNAENLKSFAELQASSDGKAGGNKRSESALDRVIDVLSRGVYATANPAMQNAKRKRNVEDIFLDSLTDPEREAYQEVKRKPAAKDMLQSLGSRSSSSNDRNPLLGDNVFGIDMDTFESIARKRKAAQDSVKQVSLSEMGEAAKRGFTGKDKTTWGDVLETSDPEAPNWVRTIGGFTLDVALDPANLIPASWIAKPLQVGGQTVKRVTPKGRASVQAGREISQHGDQLRQSFAKELDAGIIDSKLFDRVVTTDKVVTGGQRLNAARKITKGLAGEHGAKQFGEFFEANLNKAATEGRISQEAADSLLSSKHFASLDEAVKAAQQGVSAQRAASKAYPATKAADETTRAGVRQFVEGITERGRLSQAVSQTKKSGGNPAPIKKSLDQLNKKLGSVGLDLNTAKYITTPKLRSMNDSAGVAQRWSNSLTQFLESGKPAKGMKVTQSVHAVMQAQTKAIKGAITRSLGKKSNAATREISRIVDEYSAQVGRPDRQQYLDAVKSGDAAVINNYAAWHAGLFEALATGLRSGVTDEVTEAMLKEVGGHPEVMAKLAELGSAGEAVAKATPKTDAAIAQLAPPMTDALRQIVNESKEQVLAATKEMENQVLEIVAKADLRGVGKEALQDPKRLDEYMDKASNFDIPMLAQKSYNAAIDGFNKLFRAKAGLDPRINEERLRYMGMANENIAYRTKKLQEMFQGTKAKDRISTFNMFRAHGVLDEQGQVQQFMGEMERLLRPYTSEHVGHAFGPGGRFTLGDLSRWLPDKYKIPFESIIKGDRVKDWEDVFEQVLPGAAFGKDAAKTDPLEVLWNFTIANEKVVAEKATLKALADTFGVTKDSVAGTALTTKAGYVANKKFGDEVYFHPEISREIDQFFKLVHSPQSRNKMIRFYDTVNQTYKQVVTTLNPAGFNVRNSMGDAFTGYLDGVQGAHGLASYRQSAKLLRHRHNLAEQAEDAIHTPGSGLDDLGSVRQALFRTAKGKSVSVEETMALFNKHGLNSGFVQTDFGGAAAKPGRNVASRAVVDPLQRLAQNQADFFRYAHFIDRMKRSNARTVEQAGQEAADAVRKYKFDYNDYTPFEKKAMSRVIPFYKFTRKNLPLMAQMLFAQPAKMNFVPKSLSAMSQFMGYEPDGFRPDYDATDVLPEWISDRGMWPVAEFGGDVIFAQPDTQQFELLNAPTEGISGLAQKITPLATIPAELATGKTFFNNELRPTGDPKRHVLRRFPQTRTVVDIQEDGANPGLVGRDAGLGTTQVLDKDQAPTLSYRWAQFLNSPAGKKFQDEPYAGKPTGKQLKYLIDLMAMQNSIDRENK